MRLAQYESNGHYFIAFLLKGEWLDFTTAARIYAEVVERTDEPARETIQSLLSENDFDHARVKKIASFVADHKLAGLLKVGKDSRVTAPIIRPPKIMAIGRNYVLHAKEAALPVPDEPIFFMKASSSVIGPGDSVVIPGEYGRIDHEAELAVVIGRRATRVRKTEAFKYVLGYTIAQDITARELQERDIAIKNPWFRSKGFDTFMPMGPCLVLSDEIKPPVNLVIECRVNGKLRQKASTRDMVFDIPTIIEFITRHITLEPGDVISTGTPEGIGEIRPGDVLTTKIEKIGEMKNRVRGADED